MPSASRAAVFPCFSRAHALAWLALALATILFPQVAFAEDAHWEEFGPPIRSGHSLVHDPIADRLLLFGGELGDPPQSPDVWTMNLSDPDPAWFRLEVSGVRPVGRNDHVAAFDPVGNRMILFGGRRDDIGLLDDTWSLELSGPPRWTRLEFADATPPGRAIAGFLYDPVAHRMVLLGGGDQPTRTDVWTLELNGTPRWAPLPVAPAPWGSQTLHPPHAGRAIYDPVSGHVIVVGLPDYWQFDLRSMTPQWAVVPNYAKGRELVFDPVARLVHCVDRLGLLSTPIDDGTELSLSYWYRPHAVTFGVGTPKAERGHAAALDPVRRRLLTFGGEAWSGHRGRLDGVLWAFDLDGSGGWSGLGSAAVPLDFFDGPILLRDELRNRLIVWGFGRVDQGQILSRGLRAASNWSIVADSAWVASHGLHPYGSAAYDPRRDRIVVYERCGTQALAPVRTIGLATSPPSAAILPVPPPAPATTCQILGDGNGASYDGMRDRFVVFGLGVDAREVWALTLTEPLTWSRVDGSGPRPPSLPGQSWLHDRAGDRILLLGGPTPDGSPVSVWSLDLGGASPWAPLETVDPPTFQGTPTATYDLSRRRIVAHERPHTWSLELSGTPTWHRLNVAEGPQRRHAGVYDPVDDQILYFGSAEPDPSMWALRFAGMPTATLPSVLDATADDEVIRVRWWVAESTGECTIERSAEEGPWTSVDRRLPDGGGVIEYVDRTVVPGVTYAYRLRVPTPEGEHVTPAVRVTATPAALPALALLSVRPNPSVGTFRVSFMTAAPGPVVVEVVDLAGRRVFFAEAGNEGPGPSEVLIPAHRLAAGIHFLRLRQGTEVRTARLVRLD